MTLKAAIDNSLPVRNIEMQARFQTDIISVRRLINSDYNTTKHLPYIRRYIELFFNKWRNTLLDKLTVYKEEFDYLYSSLVDKLTEINKGDDFNNN